MPNTLSITERVLGWIIETLTAFRIAFIAGEKNLEFMIGFQDSAPTQEEPANLSKHRRWSFR